MQIIKQDDINIENVVEALKQGKTIVYPTETCYGLGCDATNEEAVEKVFQIKQRQKDKPVLVIAADIGMMMEYVRWPLVLTHIAEKYWPGPLSVVSQLKEDIELPSGIVGEGNTLAFRITEHPLARALSENLGKPIVSTSANTASYKSPYDIESVVAMFENAENKPDILIDAGALPHHSPSTVVRVLNGEVEVLRQGEVVVEL